MVTRRPLQLVRKVRRFGSALRRRRATLAEVVRGGRNALTPLDTRELRRLATTDRFQRGDAHLLGRAIHYVDSASFLSAFQAIFIDGIYQFKSNRQDPYIIDGGANIGLATLYWTALLPEPRIVAYEPDSNAFEALITNLDRSGLQNVSARQAALWSADGTVSFRSDGADGGRIDDRGSASVPTVRLASLLDEPVDLLKLDIEGAEVEVLLDCRHELENVDRLFVEYHGFHDQPRTLENVLTMLSDHGFRYWLQPEYAPGRPLVEATVDQGMDLRVNVFAARQTGRNM